MTHALLIRQLHYSKWASCSIDRNQCALCAIEIINSSSAYHHWSEEPIVDLQRRSDHLSKLNRFSEVELSIGRPQLQVTNTGTVHCLSLPLLCPLGVNPSVKLWHFDWLCYLRLLGECRSFLSRPSKRQSSSPSGTESELAKNDELEPIKEAPMALNHNESLKNIFNDISGQLNSSKCVFPGALSQPDQSLKCGKISPMNTEEFRLRGKQMVDYIADYMGKYRKVF